MRAGVDLGGTKIEGVILDSKGLEQARLRIPAPRQAYDGTLEALAALIAELEIQAGRTVSHLGVGIPGAVSPATGLVKNANSTWLIGKPFRQDLERRLNRPVRLENDANCFAVSEATDGAAAGAAVVFGVILGTGVGGGLVVNGKPLSGVNAIAGEWGHNPLPWPTDDERPGPACYCGKTGCIETFLSGPGLVRDHGLNGADATCVVDAASSGDTAALGAMDRYAERLARALATVINIIDPDVIVLGGGLSNIGPLYEKTPDIWSSWVFSNDVSTRLVRNRHGDSSGVRGAAWLWNPDEVSERV